jgi:hypothetical protein
MGEQRLNEATGEWRRLYNEDFHDLYTSSNIIRVSSEEE